MDKAHPVNKNEKSNAKWCGVKIINRRKIVLMAKR